MARFDKYDPKDGGFRALCGVAFATADVGKVWAVGLNASGAVVKGAGNTGVVAVVVPTEAKAIGDPIDCMTDGEIVEMTTQAGAALTAGTRYFGVAASGDFNTTNTGTPLGFTAEATRLIVRLDRATTPTT